MYTKALRKDIIGAYQCGKTQLANILRFQFPHDYETPKIRTKFPGAEHKAALQKSEATHAYDNAHAVSSNRNRPYFFVFHSCIY